MYEFKEINRPIAIHVKSEYVTSDILNFIFRLFAHDVMNDPLDPANSHFFAVYTLLPSLLQLLPKLSSKLFCTQLHILL